jgi:predicted translin family RNA/ssDNA-binding protein
MIHINILQKCLVTLHFKANESFFFYIGIKNHSGYVEESQMNVALIYSFSPFSRTIDETSSDAIFNEAEEKFNLIMHSLWNTVNTTIPTMSSFYRYHSAFSNGMQEYIEARSFWYFLKTKQLCSRQQLLHHFHSAGLVHIHVTLEDYVAGIADMSGEIMRRAVSLLSPSQDEEVWKLCDFLRWMANGLNLPCHRVASLRHKWNILQENVCKVENACCLWNLRKSEIFDRTLLLSLSQDLEYRDI